MLYCHGGLEGFTSAFSVPAYCDSKPGAVSAESLANCKRHRCIQYLRLIDWMVRVSHGLASVQLRNVIMKHWRRVFDQLDEIDVSCRSPQGVCVHQFRRQRVVCWSLRGYTRSDIALNHSQK